MSYKSLMRRSTRRHQVEFLSDSDSETEDRGGKRTPLSAPALQTEAAKSSNSTPTRPAPLSNPHTQAASAVTPVLTSMSTKTSNCMPQDLVFQVRNITVNMAPCDILCLSAQVLTAKHVSQKLNYTC
ncbi:TPA: hypothetical protein ACH3X1_000592 [Trebouxia sp. C0004]